MIMEIEIPAAWQNFRLPEGLHTRLQSLLDRQDNGEMLTPAERKEAEGLVELSEWLSLLHLQASRSMEVTALAK